MQRDRRVGPFGSPPLTLFSNPRAPNGRHSVQKGPPCAAARQQAAEGNTEQKPENSPFRTVSNRWLFLAERFWRSRGVNHARSTALALSKTRLVDPLLARRRPAIVDDHQPISQVRAIRTRPSRARAALATRRLRTRGLLVNEARAPITEMAAPVASRMQPLSARTPYACR